MRDTIELAREVKATAYTNRHYPDRTTYTFGPEQLKAFEALVRADERGSKPHSLGPGEMELSLRREHNGELFEYRHRFSAMQVMHGPIFMVTDAAKRMDDEIDAAIRARSGGQK
jgi:hypothetical protein